MEQSNKPLPQAALDNLQTIQSLREQARLHRTMGERIADSVAQFVGHITFVLLHVVVVALWMAFNTDLAPVLPRFDPYPFNLLGVLISFEAVIIATFVLIKQNRMELSDERRAQLDLQITLLTEKEVTKLISLVQRVAEHVGVADAIDAETRELGEHTELMSVVSVVHDQVGE